jgi:hypothetical protein
MVANGGKRFGGIAAVLIAVLSLALLLVLSGCSVVMLKAANDYLLQMEAVTPTVYASPESIMSELPMAEQTPDPAATVLQTSAAPAAPDETTTLLNVQPYFDIRSFHGTENQKAYIPATWQKGSSILQSEVMKLAIETVLWPVGTDSPTMSAETDVDGDGVNEALFFETEGANTIRGIFLTQGDKAVNLLNIVSDEFWNTIAPIVDQNGTFASGSVLQAYSLDLDDDGRKEIILAAGDDNEILAVSVLVYTGGQTLYQEIGGIIGRRLLFVTADHTLYVPYGNSAYEYYVEFGYHDGSLGLIGYNME